MNNQPPKKAMYFLLAGNKHPMIADMWATPKLGEIHSERRIDNLFLNEDEDFPLVQRYCAENKHSSISLMRITDSSQILFYIISEFSESKRFAYITNSETEDSLEDLKDSLEKRDFYTRIILSS